MLGTCQNNLPRDKYKEDNFRLLHAVDEAREELGFIAGEVSMPVVQSFQSNGELYITRAHNILDLKVLKFYVLESQLHNNFGILPCCQFGLLFTLGTSTNHFARCEY